ncbi:ABC transporter ATP-binding protein, partial [Acidithiobacillus ferridurans]|nr:ABC transporter ATP-binding protein [Acidithiobacillus ferridurans]
RRCEDELKRRATKAMVLVSHHADLIRGNCDHAAILENGRLRVIDDIDEAVHYYTNM